jgi:hypothetical protein
MKMQNNSKLFSMIAAALLFVLLSSGNISAHCDGIDGPVVKAAIKSLETNNINLVLIWVQKKDESEIRKIFDRTMAVRKLNPEARELADNYFFESLVRIHRAGEGEPYTGLKPAGRDLGPIIPAADESIDKNSPEDLTRHLSRSVIDGINKKFREVMENKNFKPDDVNSGRKFVAAYVEFLHYSEKLYASISGGDSEHGHSAESEHR